MSFVVVYILTVVVGLMHHSFKCDGILVRVVDLALFDENALFATRNRTGH